MRDRSSESGNSGTWVGMSSGQWGRFFGAGELRLAILSMLAAGPKHGYQLMKELRERSGGTYKASAGSIYPTLQQLEHEHLIVSERQEGRRVFSLTAAGHEGLARDPEAVRRIWNRAEDWLDWGQWMGPEAYAVASPLAALIKSTIHAVTWAKRYPEREERVRDMLKKFTHEMEEMVRNP